MEKTKIFSRSLVAIEVSRFVICVCFCSRACSVIGEEVAKSDWKAEETQWPFDGGRDERNTKSFLYCFPHPTWLQYTRHVEAKLHKTWFYLASVYSRASSIDCRGSQMESELFLEGTPY